MSNKAIVEQLLVLADDLETGSVSVIEFRDALLGHTAAVERIPYKLTKDTQLVSDQLSQTIDIGRADLIDRPTLAAWLKSWTSNVPTD